MNTSEAIGGMLTRQLLPFGLARTTRADRAANRHKWQYVTWAVEPITYEQAKAHFRTGGKAACIVQCRRGPKGGWTGATFIYRSGPWPLLEKVAGTHHYGWMHLNGAAHARDTMPNDQQWRAHLLVHAGA